MNLSNGVEPADQSQPTATNSLIARNRSHTRKRAQGHHISRGLDCRARPCQHLTLIPFLVSLTAPAVRYSEVIVAITFALTTSPKNALRPAHSQPGRTQRATSHQCWLTLLPYPCEGCNTR